VNRPLVVSLIVVASLAGWMRSAQTARRLRDQRNLAVAQVRDAGGARWI